MSSCCRQANWGNCGITLVNYAVLCVKDVCKGQFWGLRYCVSKLCSLLSLSVRCDVTQWNSSVFLSPIGRLTKTIARERPTAGPSYERSVHSLNSKTLGVFITVSCLKSARNPTGRWTDVTLCFLLLASEIQYIPPPPLFESYCASFIFPSPKWARWGRY